MNVTTEAPNGEPLTFTGKAAVVVVVGEGLECGKPRINLQVETSKLNEEDATLFLAQALPDAIVRGMRHLLDDESFFQWLIAFSATLWSSARRNEK